MQYSFREIEKRWQRIWNETQAYKVSNDTSKPKCYVLDMFPYPSGAGLHVGHPLGYIASDIYARYKRLKGFNVLHPMGFDSFGLPAEQYAIETGQHPAVTTEKNIARYKEQLNNIGFCFDWSREVKTSDPNYYKWTQWIFLQLYNSWYNPETNKAESIETLKGKIQNPKSKIQNPNSEELSPNIQHLTSNISSELMKYRLAYRAESYVNWCEALGTVLANDEVVNGVSERGSHPVERKLMSQWFLRITAYAERLLEGLNKVDFPESLREMQRNWIGRSEGAIIRFDVRCQMSDVRNTNTDVENANMLNAGNPTSNIQHLTSIQVFTTRPDTIFGVSFMVLAPEHPLVNDITSENQKQKVEEYKKYVSSRSERDRMAETKKVSGEFTGAYAIHPFTKKEIPIWIADYVLMGYGTGAIMAVPCGDSRDYAFAKHFNIDIPNIFEGKDSSENAYEEKEVLYCNSDFIDGLNYKDASAKMLNEIEAKEIGTRKVNYRMRDAGFSRQRYWGEPFPIVYDEQGNAIALSENDLPLELPYLETYSAGPNGKGPLANAIEWVNLTPNSSPLTNANLTPNPSPNGEGLGVRFSKIFTTDSERWHHLKTFARQNRKNQTEAEEILWEALRNKKLGSKVRRQHAIENYIADFYFADSKLIIEVDGEYHNNEEQKKIDASRENILNELGYKVLRFTNDEVENKLDKVLALIIEGLALSSPLSSRRGEGGEVSVKMRETDTMPGYAGSSWYYLRYMDPHNEKEFCSKEISSYWNQVDVYVGGAEHAVGHLLYSRMWCKVLCDLGYINYDEPYKKLINQGMIQGSSRFVHRIDGTNILVSEDYKKEIEKYYSGNQQIFKAGLIDDINKQLGEEVFSQEGHFANMNTAIQEESEDGVSSTFHITDISSRHADVNVVDGHELDIEAFKKWRPEYADAKFILEDGKYISGDAVEKMSKSKYNVVNPDDIIDQYGADTFRMYEMFLGAIEISKPWDTKGIEGVHRFLRKLWRLYVDENIGCIVNDEKATKEELKLLHQTIKKIEHDTENFAFNTSVSQFMICVNELSKLNCNKREILEPLLILLTPFAPHISEELWHTLGNKASILDATFPVLNEEYLKENSFRYPVAVNGKTRTEYEFALDAEQSFIEDIILKDDIVTKWMEDKPVKKFIYVKNKMINVVV